MTATKKKSNPDAILFEWYDDAFVQFEELIEGWNERRRNLAERLEKMRIGGGIGLAGTPIYKAINAYDDLIEKAKCVFAGFRTGGKFHGKSRDWWLSAIASLSLSEHELRMAEIRALSDSADPVISNDGIEFAMRLMRADFEGRKALAAKKQRVEQITHRENQITTAKAENIKVEVKNQFAACGNLTAAREAAARKYGVSLSSVRTLTPSGSPRGRPKK